MDFQNLFFCFFPKIKTDKYKEKPKTLCEVKNFVWTVYPMCDPQIHLWCDTC